MKKLYLILLFHILLSGNIFSQQWEWSRVLPAFPSYSYQARYTAKTGDNYFIYNTNYNVSPESSIIIHMDPFGNITDSLKLNFKFDKFSTDLAGNYLLAGFFIDSLNYSNAVIHSHGFHDFYLLKITSSGNLIFLKGFGSKLADYEIPIIQFDSTNKIYFTSGLRNNLLIDKDSIVHDTAYEQIALLIFNPDGNLNSHIANSFQKNPYGYSSHSPGGITFSNSGDIFIHYSYCYPYDCDAGIIKYSASHDSLDSFQGGMMDNSSANVYYFTNSGGHYYGEPVIHKYNLADQADVWAKNLGGTYQSFELSATLLPENILLTFGRGGGSGGSGTATLDDTTLTFGRGNEMLLALMDTTGHFYNIRNDKVPNTRFLNATYDDRSNAYLISIWNTDTTYTMGTSVTTSGSNYVISKLNYMDVTTGIPVQDHNSNISLFPNPSQGHFTLLLNGQLKPWKICVYDVLGNCILTQEAASASKEIDLSNKAKGIYFVEINTGKEKINKKIILN